MTDDLRAKAEAATRQTGTDDWWWDSYEGVYGGHGDDAFRIASIHCPKGRDWHKTAAYIAAADPTTILALLDERDRLERALEDANALLANAFDERDRLLAVLEEARLIAYKSADLQAAIARHDEGRAEE